MSFCIYVILVIKNFLIPFILPILSSNLVIRQLNFRNLNGFNTIFSYFGFEFRKLPGFLQNLQPQIAVYASDHALLRHTSNFMTLTEYIF
jgi:hypothetical protein